MAAIVHKMTLILPIIFWAILFLYRIQLFTVIACATWYGVSVSNNGR